ncbi:MAG: hypothetical protein PVI75_00795 [Gammaproteobacteria bacterium]|jgi:hypothetical protein
MRLWFAARDRDKHSIKAKFAAWWQILGFIVVAVILLLFFFPKEGILGNIAQQREADRLAKLYLQNLVDLYPGNKQFHILLAEQNVRAGEVVEAVKQVLPFVVVEPKTKTDWHALLIYYKIVRIETYSKPRLSYARTRGMQKMQQLLEVLLKGNFAALDMLMLAQDAVKLNRIDTALAAYNKITAVPPAACVSRDMQMCLALSVDGAKFMLSQSKYKAAAQLYFLAQLNSTSLADKRLYFINGLKCLQSGNMLEDAMQAAQKHIGSLAHDKKTLVFLTRLALMSNEPKLAQQYIRRALQLKQQVTKP